MKLTSSIPVLRAANYPRARSFWTETLGFAVVEEGGSPAQFGIFRKDAATVFVDAWQGGDAEPSPGWRAYFHVDHIDDWLASLPDGTPVDGPRDTVYGMREIEMTDPDGNRLCFGMDLS